MEQQGNLSAAWQALKGTRQVVVFLTTIRRCPTCSVRFNTLGARKVQGEKITQEDVKKDLQDHLCPSCKKSADTFLRAFMRLKKIS